jgi:hypothetical protein
MIKKLSQIQAELKDYIKNNFIYNNDGTLTRLDRKNSNGSLDKDGYLIIKVKTKQFKAHRISWLLNYGDFPNSELDHINRNRTDNRIENLREATRIENIFNRNIDINPDTGVTGIYLDKATKGLKAKYTFRHNHKTYRFRNLGDAIKKKELLCTV